MHNVESYFQEFDRRDWQTVTEERPVRLAVIGLGWFARDRALPAIEKATLCETTALVSGSPEKALTVADQFDVDHVIAYDEFHEGHAVDAYDAVYIATPNALHLEYAETAASFGKHALVEKPLEVTVERAERLVDACEQADVTLMTAYRLQLEPAVRRTRELIADGFVGEPVRVIGNFGTRLLDNVEPGSWRLDPELAGGGALIDVGIYPINTARYLLDEDPTCVCATTASVHEPFTDVDEHVAVQLGCPDGVSASCAASFNAHPNSHLHVIGTEGQIRIDSPFGGTVPHEILAERGEMRVEHVGPPVDEVEEEFEYFAHCILTETTPEPDGWDGLTDVRVIEAAYESTESGTRIDL